MRRILFVALLGLFFAFPSFAAEYYINAGIGNDASTGMESDPWKTLSMINSTNISPGDTVNLIGDFIPTATVTLDAAMQGGDYENHTVIQGDGATVKLDASFTNGVFNVTGNNYTISGIEFNNQGTYLAGAVGIGIQANKQYIDIQDCVFRDAQYGIVGVSDSFLNIEDGVFYNNNQAIYLNSIENTTIVKNFIHDNTANAILLLGTSINNVVANNIVYNNTNVGISPGSVTTNVAVINNTIIHNNYGVACEGYGSGVIVKNNIIAQNQTAGVVHYDLSPMIYDYNLYYSNAQISLIISVPFHLDYYDDLKDWQALGFDEHSFGGDALLDSDNHLQSGSPAIDTGLDLSDRLEDDFDGDARYWGQGWDIGADEYLYLDVPTNPKLTEKKIYKAYLTWNAVDNASEYQVQYRKGNGSTYETATSTTNSLELDNLSDGGKYYWQVKAVNGGVESDWSVQKRLITYPRKVLQSEYRIKEVLSDRAKVQVDSMAKRITGFNVLYHKKVNGTWIKQGMKKIKNKPDQNYCASWITGLDAGTKYKYRVKARRVVGPKKFLSQKTTYKYFTTLE